MRSDRRFTLAAVVLSLAALYTGVRWGAMVAGGSDPYGYVSQAGYWQRGSVVVHEDVIRPSPWPSAAATWSPLGYRPSPVTRDAIVPIYPPGLPLLMAVFQQVGGFRAAFLIVPLSGALTIWLTYLLGRRVFDAPSIALSGACLVATSPVFLYQLMNAMSDVPVTAVWTLAMMLAVSRRPLAAGLTMSAAIAIRPNLAPLAGVLLAWIVASEARERDVSRSLAAALRLAVGVAVAVVGISWFNSRVYGSVLTSGYGTASDYYAWRYVATNARQFATWLADVETPVVALALLFFVVPRWLPMPRLPFARLLLGGTIAVVILSYLFYLPFDVWWYLRFLLPMWPAMMLLTAAAIDAIVRRWMPPLSPWAMAAAISLLSWHGIYVARDRSTFALGQLERRYIDVARFIAAHTPPEAVILSRQHSGSLRIYADRLTMQFDDLDTLWLDRAVAYLQSIGRRPYYVLDGAEVDAFKQRFGAANQTGRLDWPPIAVLGDSIAIYDPIDRRLDTLPVAIGRTRGNHVLGEAPQIWPPVLRMK